MPFCSGVCQAVRPLPTAGCKSGFVLGKIADKRQLECLVTVGLKHQQQPEKEPGQHDKTREGKNQYAHSRNQLHQRPEYGRSESECESNRPKKNVLAGMETHKAVVLERLQV